MVTSSQKKALRPGQVKYLLRVMQLVGSLCSFACILSLYHMVSRACVYGRDVWGFPQSPRAASVRRPESATGRMAFSDSAPPILISAGTFVWLVHPLLLEVT